VQIWQFACGAVLGMMFEAVGALFALWFTKTKKKVPAAEKASAK
jgi:hypothetical protein